MAIFPQTAFVGSVSYESGTAVFYFDRGRTSFYAVATGIPRDRELRLKAYIWEGHFDREGSTTIVNRDQNPHHHLARSIRIDIVLVTSNKLMAYWVQDRALEWRKQVYGWAPPVPPPLPEP